MQTMQRRIPSQRQWFEIIIKSIFGSIKLDGHWLNMNSFKSQILTDERQMSDLIKLCDLSPNDKWSLLYRGTRDGSGSRDFHSRCDGHSNTLTILKAKQSSYIFGAFTKVSWESSTNGKWELDPNAFIFSLTNKDNKPLKMKIDSNRHKNAIFCDSEYGPTFGDGHDIHIGKNSNTTMNSYSDLGCTYSHPQYGIYSDIAQAFLAGSLEFEMCEFEVYKKE